MKPAPVKVAPEIVTVPKPVLVTVKLCVAVFPTAMLPKAKPVALGERKPERHDGREREDRRRQRRQERRIEQKVHQVGCHGALNA